jgi:hypothetical protein
MTAYDLVVVGAGIAGSEAAFALARRGYRVALCSQSLDTVYWLFTAAQPPFPPGTLLAQEAEPGLGGWTLHSRIKYRLEAQPNLHLLQASITGLLIQGRQVAGVTTWEGPQLAVRAVVLAVGSFLDPRLYLGQVTEAAGRLSEAAYPDLYEQLVELGFNFAPGEGEVASQPGSPGYTVTYQVFAPGEWQAEHCNLTRLKGLYATGLCVLGRGDYALMAREGQRLGQNLAVELG